MICSVWSSPLLCLCSDLPSISLSSHTASGSPLSKPEHSTVSQHKISPQILWITHNGRCTFNLRFSLWVQSQCPVWSVTTLARTVPEWVTHQYFTACLKLPTEMKEPYDPVRIKNVWYYCRGWEGFFDKVLCTGKLWLSKSEIVGKDNWNKIWRLLKYSTLIFWKEHLFEITFYPPHFNV